MTSSKIEQELAQFLREQQTPTKVLVSFTDDLDALQKSLETREFADRNERLNTVHQELNDFAEKAQKPVIDVLQSQQASRVSNLTWKSFWVSNQIAVEEADLALVEAIAEISNVARIEGEKFMQLHKSLVRPPVGLPKPADGTAPAESK